MSEERKRLVISPEDLPPGQPATPAPPPAGPVAATELPTVEGVRPPARSVGVGADPIGFGGTLPNNVVAAVLAALVGWGVFRLAFPHPVLTSDLVAHTALQIGVFGGAFGAVFAAWEDARSGLWESALRAALGGLALGAVGGAISGAVAEAIFEQMVESIISGADSFSELTDLYSSAQFYFARALGWAIFGAGAGLALGVARRSSRAALNGAIGGVVGGALGGLVFHFASIKVEDEAMAQLAGFAVVGLGIGAAVGLVEVARRQAWLKIVAGGMLGKEFILYHQVTNLGSSPQCEVTLIKDSRVAPFHCRIDDRGGRYSITAYEGAEVRVNGTPVTNHWLRAGDTVELGGTSLTYQERQTEPIGGSSGHHRR
jgi:hypothetical protein